MNAKARFVAPFGHFGVALIAGLVAVACTLVLASVAAADSPPAVTVDAPSQVGVTSVHLKGSVDPEGGPSAARWHFQLSTTGDPDTWFDGPSGDISSEAPEGGGPAPSEGSDPIEVAGNAEGLQPSQEYFVRLVAENELDPESGEYGNRVETEAPYPSFTTNEANVPTVVIDSPVPGYTSAHISGSINPNGGNDNPATGGATSLYWVIEYTKTGEENWLHAAEAEISQLEPEGGGPIPANSTDPIAISADLPAGTLEQNQSYEVRVFTYYASFTLNRTFPEPPAANPSFETLEVTKPVVTIDPVSENLGESVHLSGTVDPGGADPAFNSECVFKYMNESPQNEQQSFYGDPYNPTYTLKFTDPVSESVETTTELIKGSPATGPGSVQGALEQLAAVGPGQVLVSNLPPVNSGALGYLVEFRGALAGKEIAPLQTEDPSVGETIHIVRQGHPQGYFDAYATNVPCDPATIEGVGPVDVSADLTGLFPGASYGFRLQAKNSGGIATAEGSFTPPLLPPTVVAGPVGGTTDRSARLTAFVDPNGQSTVVTFEYAAEPTFTNPVAAPNGPGSEVNGNGNQLAYADVAGLNQETDYYWRVKVQGSAGTDADTAPKSFRLWPTPGPTRAGGSGVEGKRTLELVSAPNITSSVFGIKTSVDGDQVLYSILGGTPDTSFGQIGNLIATRTATGWRSQDPLPPRSVFGPGVFTVSVQAASPDLSKLAVLSGPTAQAYGPQSYFRITPFKAEVLLGATVPAGVGASTAMASEDLMQMVGRVASARFGDTPPQLVDLTDPDAPIVSRLPDGSPPACGVPVSDFVFQNATTFQNWMSSEGDRVVFHSSGNDCSGPKQLYQRRGGVDGETILISGPPVSGPLTSASFAQASADGTRVFFTTATRLDPRDENSTIDIYRYTDGGGNSCLTCAVAEADVIAPPQPSATGGVQILVAQDGSRVYFTSREALAPGASPAGSEVGSSAVNLYVWRAATPNQIEFISRADVLDVTSRSNSNASATGDGRVFVFRSSQPELNAATGSDNGETRQYYRWDDSTRALSCVSCPAGKPAGESVDFMSRQQLTDVELRDVLSADGRAFIFTTPVSLAPTDVNESADLYEWHDGNAWLVSDGHSSQAPEGQSISADGRDIVFRSAAGLTEEAPTTSAIYDARLGGGFDVPRNSCDGDACLPAPSPPPPDASPATPSFAGRGNQKPPRRCAKGKALRKGRCVAIGKKRVKHKRDTNDNRRTSR